MHLLMHVLSAQMYWNSLPLFLQKLLENIQLKEQQKILEQHHQQQLHQLVSSGQASPEILAQALKTVLPVVSVEVGLVDSLSL